MAKSRKTVVEKPVGEIVRTRTFIQGETNYEIWGTEKNSGAEECLASAKNAPAALATFQLAQSMGSKTHINFYVKKVSLLTIADGELTASE